jgi:nicotinamidase-related amidase
MNRKTKTTEENRLGAANASPEDIQGDRLPESRQSRDKDAALRGSINGELEETYNPEGDLHRRIAERAFLLYEESGFRHGNDLEHWLEAERQVKTLGV